MNTNAKNTGEDIFFEIYEYISEKADYLQPGEGSSWFLPEVIISSLVTTIVIDFLNGFFGKIGEDLFDKIKKTTVNRGELKNCDTKSLVKYLNDKLPEIKKQRDRVANTEIIIYQELVELGLSEKNSKLIASKAIEIIRKQVDDN